MLWGVPLTALKRSTSPGRALTCAGLNRKISFSGFASIRISWTLWASALVVIQLTKTSKHEEMSKDRRMR
jgi:hypothetical protein